MVNQKLKEKEVMAALASLIRNTRRKHRYLSLVEIADNLDLVIQGLGNINIVADRLGMSHKMLRQFQKVKQLTPSVQSLFASREIDSVDIADHLSKLDGKDQIFVAQKVVEGVLNSKDVRAVHEFHKENTELKIEEVVRKIEATRNVKHYVVEFVVRSKRTKPELIQERFAKVLGDENIISLSIKGSIGRLVLNDFGKKKLQVFAGSKGMTKAEVVGFIIRGEDL